MSRPAHLREKLLRMLPPYSARRWVFPRELARRMPSRNGIHAALAYMVKCGHACRKSDSRTGLYVYARAKRKRRPE